MEGRLCSLFSRRFWQPLKSKSVFHSVYPICFFRLPSKCRCLSKDAYTSIPQVQSNLTCTASSQDPTTQKHPGKFWQTFTTARMNLSKIRHQYSSKVLYIVRCILGWSWTTRFYQDQISWRWGQLWSLIIQFFGKQAVKKLQLYSIWHA